MKRLALLLVFFLIAASARGAVPGWIKPGLVVVYAVSGGSAVGNPDFYHSSGSAATGYQIFVVHDVEGGKVYGSTMILLGSMSGGPNVLYRNEAGEIGVLSGNTFFVDPNQVKMWLKGRPPEGCRVMGNPGNIAVECRGAGSVERLSITYNTRTGLITQMASGATQQAGHWASTQSIARFVRMFTTNLPRVPFPPVAASSHTYRVISTTPMGSMVTGQMSATYTGRRGPLVVYRIVGTGFYKQAYGTRYMGPFYVHPALLRMGTILSIPDASFQVTASAAPQGVVVSSVWRGQVILQDVYHPATGLLLMERQPVPGVGYQTVQLVR